MKNILIPFLPLIALLVHANRVVIPLTFHHDQQGLKKLYNYIKHTQRKLIANKPPKIVTLQANNHENQDH